MDKIAVGVFNGRPIKDAPEASHLAKVAAQYSGCGFGIVLAAAVADQFPKVPVYLGIIGTPEGDREVWQASLPDL